MDAVCAMLGQNEDGSPIEPTSRESSTTHGCEGLHPVLINVSPLCRPHGLLVPHAAFRQPQVLTLDALELALHLLAMPGADGLRVAFNSLGAWASVNHLHLHIVAAAFRGAVKGSSPEEIVEQTAFPVEASPETVVAGGGSSVAVAELLEWPAGGWSFRHAARSDGGDGGAARALLAEAAMALVSALQAADVAHSVLASECGERVIVLPRRKQAATGDGSLNVAVMEICGRGIVNFAEGWDGLTAPALAAQLAATRLEGPVAEFARAAAVGAVHTKLAT